MKVVVTCAKTDAPTLDVLRDNDQLQMLDLFAEAVSSDRRLMVFQIDNSGVTLDREFPKRLAGASEPQGA